MPPKGSGTIVDIGVELLEEVCRLGGGLQGPRYAQDTTQGLSLLPACQEVGLSAPAQCLAACHFVTP